MPTFAVPVRGDFTLTVGSDPQCDLALPMKDEIAPRHIMLRRKGDRLFAKDLGGPQGSSLNGVKLGGRWEEITLYDELYLGRRPLKIDASLLIGRERIGLAADHLYFGVKSRHVEGGFRTLSDRVSLRAEPGTMTAVMGPSGAGKTVLLNLLSGNLRPTPSPDGRQGRVTLNGSFDMHRDFHFLKHFIGFVPQDDIVIPELTVAQCLDYTLKLRYTDMQPRIRRSVIESVCERMGFRGGDLGNFLSTRIGSPQKRGLSGGERKRVNIAVELARRPLLLFLDEPTSGLSSADSNNLMSTLKDLCVESGITMILTIHQPSEQTWGLFDQVALLAKGGRPAYIGPPERALSSLGQAYDPQRHGANPADAAISMLQEWQATGAAPVVGDGASVLWGAEQAPGGQAGDRAEEKGLRSAPPSFVKQCAALFTRQLSIAKSDWASLAIQLGQAPLIALLMLMCMSGYRQDFNVSDEFVRIGLWYENQYGQTERLREADFPAAKAWAAGPEARRYISESSAGRRATVLFLLLVSALWFGLLHTCKEIVSERSVLRRELKHGVGVGAYLIAKLIYFSGLLALQTLLLAVMVLSLLPDFPFLLIWGMMWLTALLAAGLGLMISALVPTERAALASVVIVMMPQLIMGGLLRPLLLIKDTPFYLLSHAVLQKWAFKLSLSLDAFFGFQTIRFEPDLSRASVTESWDFSLEHSAEAYFGVSVDQLQWQDIALSNIAPMIVLHGLVPIAVAWLLIRKLGR